MFTPAVLGEVAYYLDPSAVLQQLAKSRYRISFLERQALETMDRVPDSLISGLRYEAKMVRKPLRSLSLHEKIECLERGEFLRMDRVWTERLRERLIVLLKREDRSSFSVLQRDKVKSFLPMVENVPPPGMSSQVEMLLSNEVCEAEVVPEPLSEEAQRAIADQKEFEARRPRYKGRMLLGLHQRGELTNESGKHVDVFLDMLTGTWQEREKQVLDRVTSWIPRPPPIYANPSSVAPPPPPVGRVPMPMVPLVVLRTQPIASKMSLEQPPPVPIKLPQPLVEYFNCVVITVVRQLRARVMVGFAVTSHPSSTLLKVHSGTLKLAEWYSGQGLKWMENFPSYKSVMYGVDQHRHMKTQYGLAMAPAYNLLWRKIVAGALPLPTGQLPLWSIKLLTAPERLEQSMMMYRYYSVRDLVQMRRELTMCLYSIGCPRFLEFIYCYIQAQYETLLNTEVISKRKLNNPGLTLSLSPEIWTEAARRTCGCYPIALFHRTVDGIESVKGRAAHSKNLYIVVDLKHTVRITVSLYLPVMIRDTLQWPDVIPIERVSGVGALVGREQWSGNQVIWRISPLPNFSVGSVLWINVVSAINNCWICSRPFEFVRYEDREGEIRPLTIFSEKGPTHDIYRGVSEQSQNWGSNISTEIVHETDVMRFHNFGTEIGWYCPVYHFYFKVSDLPELGPLTVKHRDLVATRIVHVNSNNCL